MTVFQWLDGLPLPFLFLLTLLYALLAIFLGIRLSALGKSPISGESIGPATGATLGLLAFMLAFTFNMTASRFDGRKQLLMDEVNAIGSAHLRSGLVAASYSRELRALIEEYADLRASLALREIAVGDAISRSESLQTEMWREVERMVSEQPPSVYSSLLIQSLNNMFDLQSSRVMLGLQFRIPASIWIGLNAIAGLAMMLVGYQLGSTGRRRVIVSCTLATAFSAVILMIADLDRAGEGFTSVNQQAFIELAQRLHGRD